MPQHDAPHPLPAAAPPDPHELASQAFDILAASLHDVSPLGAAGQAAIAACAKAPVALALLDTRIKSTHSFSHPLRRGAWDAIAMADPALASRLVAQGALGPQHSSLGEWSDGALDHWGMQWSDPLLPGLCIAAILIQSGFGPVPGSQGSHGAERALAKHGWMLRRCAEYASLAPHGKESLEAGAGLAACAMEAVAAACGPEARGAATRLAHAAKALGLPSDHRFVLDMARFAARAARATRKYSALEPWGGQAVACFHGSDHVAGLRAMLDGAKMQGMDRKILAARFETSASPSLQTLLWIAIDRGAIGCANELLDRGAALGMTFFEDLALENVNLLSKIALRLDPAMTAASPQRKLFLRVSLALAQALVDHGATREDARRLVDNASKWMHGIASEEALAACEAALMDQALALDEWVRGASKGTQRSAPAKRL